MYDVRGGAGTRITNADPGTRSVRRPAQRIGAVVSPDGPIYLLLDEARLDVGRQICELDVERRDLRTGAEQVVIPSHGAAMRPAHLRTVNK